jgi:hypothetical protein
MLVKKANTVVRYVRIYQKILFDQSKFIIYEVFNLLRMKKVTYYMSLKCFYLVK